jgi:mitogen-activated protein kinase 7
MQHLFHLPDRWRLLRPLGQGAYGLVISVQDSLSGEPVAVKCITRVFDKTILSKRALREITLLRHFGEHENLTGCVLCAAGVVLACPFVHTRVAAGPERAESETDERRWGVADSGISLIDLDNVWDGYNEM